MKLKLYRLLFRIVSYLVDITKGSFSFLVKYKLIIGGIIIALSNTSCYKRNMMATCYGIPVKVLTDKKVVPLIVDEPTCYIMVSEEYLVSDSILSSSIYEYEKIDIPPVSPEGELINFIDWVQNNIKYSDAIHLNKNQEDVIVSFIIDTEGNLKDVKIKRSLCQEADDEVIRVMSLSKPWIPGQYQGQTVNTEIYLFISFLKPQL